MTIRDSEDTGELEVPTTFAATVDDASGVISDGTFSAAPLSFAIDIVEPIETTVYVDAVFTQITPGGVTGLVKKLPGGKADVTLSVDVRVDLHIEVGSPSFLTADCPATPVSLRLTSASPYDEATDRLTLEDADFRVPAVDRSNNVACPSIVADAVDERLAGSGHSISMEMAGEIPAINIGIYPTTTTLDVEPASSRQGDEVTLTTTITPNPEAEPDPGPLPAVPIGGIVEFHDGTTVLGTAAIDGSGQASITTDTLPVGNRSLVAVYQGDKEYTSSTSPAVSHLVAAAPTVTLPDPISSIVIDGNPRPVTVGLANPAEFGEAITGARLDLTVARTDTNSADLTPERMSLEHFDGSAWTPVTLTETSPRVLTGSISGLDLAPGDTREARFRYKAFAFETTQSTTQCGPTNPTCPGRLALTANLVTGDGVRTLANDEVPVNLVEKARRPSTATFPAPSGPHTVRQGSSFMPVTILGPSFGSVLWGGLFELYIDGTQVPVRDISAMPFEAGYIDQFAVRSATVSPWALLPADIEPGTHWFTVRYLGDPFHGPAELSSTFTVLERPEGSHPFVCREQTLSSEVEWGANMIFDVTLPATVRAGTQVAFSATDARMLMHRRTLSGLALFAGNNLTVPVGSTGLEALIFDLAGHGEASGLSVTRTGDAIVTAREPRPLPESSVDQTFDVHDVTGSVTISGEPGEVVPVELSEFVMDYHDPSFNFPLEVRCTARDGLMRVGEVEVAGTSVSVSPELAREGVDEVTIEARTFPSDAAGTVSFSSDRDGPLGSSAVADGVASLSTTTLSPGTHVVTAAFDATAPGLDSVGTATVRVVYSPRGDTEAFVIAARTDYTGGADQADVVADAAALDGGKSRIEYLGELSRSDAYLTHVVDEMYLDTLGREGDEAGVAYWVGRLKGGLSVARVAASFYSSDEYFGRVGGTDEAWVRDLYDVLLGRAADDPGLAYWIAEIPKRGRGGVALAFFQTPESARARVTGLYQQFLGRAPSAADRDFWASRVIARGDLILAVELTLSPEYANRAGNRFPLV